MLHPRAVGAVLAVAAGAGAALAVAAPGAGAPSTGSFTAVDPQMWVGSDGGNTATIAAGGTVTFSYPSSGTSAHNVLFDSSQPTSCTQTSGSDSGSVPPLPNQPTPPSWTGSCRFNTPGTYAFHCVMHPGMTGTVVVEAAGSTTDTTTGGSTSPTGTSGTTTPGSGNSTSPTAKPRAKVTRRQRGTVVRGSVTTPVGPSRIVVTAFASNRALSAHRPKKAKRVRVGSQTKRSTGTAGASFAVKLNATARRALQRRHRLSVSVRIVVTPTIGSAATTTATVTLRPR